MNYSDVALYRYRAAIALTALAITRRVAGKPRFDHAILLSQIAATLKEKSSAGVIDTVDRIMLLARTPSLIHEDLVAPAEAALVDAALYKDLEALSLLAAMAHEHKCTYQRIQQRHVTYCRLPPSPLSSHVHTAQSTARQEAHAGGAQVDLHPYAD